MVTSNPMDRVERELSDRGISLADFAEELGESKQSVNNWKKRGIPGSKQHKIARALGWTVERLLTGNDETATLSVKDEPGGYAVTPQEKRLLNLVRSLNDEQRDSFLSFVNMFVAPNHSVDIPHGGILDTKALTPHAQRQNGKKKSQAKKNA